MQNCDLLSEYNWPINKLKYFLKIKIILALEIMKLAAFNFKIKFSRGLIDYSMIIFGYIFL